MLQKVKKANEINETVADVIVAQFRAHARKTGISKTSYDEFDIQKIAQAVTPEWYLASTFGVSEALNTVHGVKAVYDDSLQIGPSEWLEVIHLTLD